MKQYLWVLLLLMTAHSVAQGQQVKFYAAADTDKVLQGGVVNVTFTIEATQKGDFAPPDFNWLEQLGGPSRRQSTTIVNGRQSSSMAYTYQLQCNKIGTFSIGPATFKVGRNMYQTKPLEIQVVEPSQRRDASIGSQDYIVRLEVSDTTLYIGQQVTVEYVLYYRKEVANYQIINESDYDGFFVTTANQISKRGSREIINGQEYYRTVLKRIHLFPQKQGATQLGPMSARLGIPASGSRGVFGFQRVSKYEVLDIRPVTLTVSTVPDPEDLGFTGAVGQFGITAKIDRTRLSTDDAVLLTLEVNGNGDIRNITPPIINLGPDWEVYPPKLLSEDDMVKGSEIIMYQRYEYLLVPQRTGSLSIAPRMTYYDPQQGDFAYARSRAYKVDVTEGQRTITIDDREVGGAYELSDDVPATESYNYRTSFLGSLTHHLMIGAVLLVVLLLYKTKRNNDAYDSLDPSIKRRQQAARKATKTLAAAKVYLDAKDPRAFYTELSSAVYGYLGDKYQLDISRASLDQLIKDLQAVPGVLEEYVDSTRHLLQQCQQSLYAAGDGGGMQEHYDSASALIRNLEDS